MRRGDCSNLISVPSAKTRNAATKMSSLKMRACTVTRGVTAVAAAAASAGRSGSTSRAKLNVPKISTPPAKAARIRAS